jgi:branched-chain amino acid transport system permease protein
MSTFINLTVYGLADGAILALAALGFVLIYKATSVINFAQGEFLLVGAYMFYTAFVVLQLPLALAVVFGVVVATLIGVLVERLILRPMVGENPISIIMVTIGLSIFLRSVVQMFYGTRPQAQPPVLPTGSVNVLGATIPVNRIFVLLIAAVVLTAFTVFFRRSRHAVDQNIAAFGLLVFPVVILGGLDSVPGTIVGGLTIGLLKQFTSGYLDPGLATVIPYVVLVLILLVRPYGIFGETRIERV